MTSSTNKKPSIIRQIMDEVDDLDEGAKKLLLLKLKKESLMERYKQLDDEIAKNGEVMSEEEIDELVSETRKNIYEQKFVLNTSVILKYATHSNYIGFLI